ncbi:MAG: hypothetical protein IJI68_06490 [Eggerthellaceae bacterium]|nr:hypothetical protein [Eggerthellaceae bacterium]
MKRKILLAASLAVALVLGMSIVPAGAYFTDTTETNGGVDVTITPSTDIHEWVTQGVKHVVISNDADATSAVYVRAGVFTSVEVDISHDGWTGPSNEASWVGPTDLGWFYYDQILQPGESTDSELIVDTLLRKKAEQKPEEGVNFNVIVMYEATPVLYDADGNPYADWTLTQNEKPAEGGN